MHPVSKPSQSMRNVKIDGDCRGPFYMQIRMKKKKKRKKRRHMYSLINAKPYVIRHESLQAMYSHVPY